MVTDILQFWGSLTECLKVYRWIKDTVTKVLAYVRIHAHNIHRMQHTEDTGLWKKKEWQ